MFHPDCEPEKDLDCFTNLDWNEEAPYEIAFDKNEGRYLRATRDIEPGELIIEESVLLRAPISGVNKDFEYVHKTQQFRKIDEKNTLWDAIVCLGCLKPLFGSWVTCSVCGGTLCSIQCKDSADHKMECSILAQQNIKLTDDERFINSYDLILPLRILSLRSKQKQWKPFWKMMSHLKAFKQNKEWMEKQKNVIDFILKKLKIPDVSEELLLTALAIDSVNGRTVNFLGNRVRLIHPLSSLLSHDCCPNVNKYYSGISKGNYINLRASVAIKKGEKLTVCYTDTLLPTSMRQKNLKEKYFIDCCCQRCMDATDFETYGNSLICSKCPEGIYSPPDWKCSKCQMKFEKPLQTIEKASNEAMILFKDKTKWTVENLNMYLNNYSKLLHPNHILFTKIKTKLCSLPELSMDKIGQNKDKMEEKMKLLNDTLDILDKIQPDAINSVKGLLLYDLHLTSFFYVQFVMENTEENMRLFVADDLKKKYVKCFKVLEQGLEFLHYELEGTYENSIFRGAIIGMIRNNIPMAKKYLNCLGDEFKNMFAL